MKWAPVQVCVYLARLMRRRCSVIALSSGMHSHRQNFPTVARKRQSVLQLAVSVTVCEV